MTQEHPKIVDMMPYLRVFFPPSLTRHCPPIPPGLPPPNGNTVYVFVSLCSHHAPSLVILDDLDKIAPAEGDDAEPFNAQAARIAETLEDLFISGAQISFEI